MSASQLGRKQPPWLGTAAGLYPELKVPALYASRGVDMTHLLADSLRRLRLADRPAGSLIVQSFDDRPLRELAREFPSIPRTFLIDTRDGAPWLSRDGLTEVARFATGIGPSRLLIDGRPDVAGSRTTRG